MLGACLRPSPLAAQVLVPDQFSDTAITVGLDNPVGIAFVPDVGTRVGRRLFVVEQHTWKVRLLVDGAPAAVDPAGVVSGIRDDFLERGLLGIAVDPGWPLRPYVYVHFTAVDGHVHVARFTATGDLAFTGNGAVALDSTSRYEVIADVPDVNVNHNGGTLRFGPDGMLWASFGDDAQGCPAQDTTSLLGKILRVDVSRLPAGPGGPAPKGLIAPPDNPFAAYPDSNARLVAALGLRNPFRFQLDPVDTSMVIADVGENTWEELDRVRPGANCGWPLYEAFAPFGSCANVGSALTFPIYTYDHTQGIVIIALGTVRRGVARPYQFPADYEGDILIADYYAGWIRRVGLRSGGWSLVPSPGQPDAVNWGTRVFALSDATFGPDGALWYVLQNVSGNAVSGQIHAVRYLAPAGVTATRQGLELARPWPDPAPGPVALAYTLPRAGPVELAVHDLAGRRVRVLADGTGDAGPHQLSWDGRDDHGRALPAGLYLVSLRAGGERVTRHLVLAR
ncbi:MAG TPA: PQQ-dependent sugar dehydrogenase [Candidatus Eisenbacteria bacterium]|nr:PQQ-dependent sugar dehydrogenase [Candidatus Eisenbacteria bacterium]